MYINPFMCQLLAEERMKDALCQAEQARLIRTVKASGQWGRWRLPLTFALKSLLALFIRPHS